MEITSGRFCKEMIDSPFSSSQRCLLVQRFFAVFCALGYFPDLGEFSMFVGITRKFCSATGSFGVSSFCCVTIRAQMAASSLIKDRSTSPSPSLYPESDLDSLFPSLYLPLIRSSLNSLSHPGKWKMGNGPRFHWIFISIKRQTMVNQSVGLITWIEGMKANWPPTPALLVDKDSCTWFTI